MLTYSKTVSVVLFSNLVLCKVDLELPTLIKNFNKDQNNSLELLKVTAGDLL